MNGALLFFLLLIVPLLPFLLLFFYLPVGRGIVAAALVAFNPSLRANSKHVL